MICVLALLGCKEQQPNESQQETIIVQIPDDFVDFYQQFHSDSLFQMEHIVFPLAGKSDSSAWQAEDWILHQPIDNSSEEFDISLDNFESIIIETIRDRQGLFSMVRRFADIGSGWNLIYYNVQEVSFGTLEE